MLSLFIRTLMGSKMFPMADLQHVALGRWRWWPAPPWDPRGQFRGGLGSPHRSPPRETHPCTFLFCKLLVTSSHPILVSWNVQVVVKSSWISCKKVLHYIDHVQIVLEPIINAEHGDVKESNANVFSAVWVILWVLYVGVHSEERRFLYRNAKLCSQMSLLLAARWLSYNTFSSVTVDSQSTTTVILSGESVHTKLLEPVLARSS